MCASSQNIPTNWTQNPLDLCPHHAQHVHRPRNDQHRTSQNSLHDHTLLIYLHMKIPTANTHSHTHTHTHIHTHTHTSERTCSPCILTQHVHNVNTMCRCPATPRVLGLFRRKRGDQRRPSSRAGCFGERWPAGTHLMRLQRRALSSITTASSIRGRTLSAWIKLINGNQRGSGFVGVQRNPSLADQFVSRERV